jgi:hypothetical protein
LAGVKGNAKRRTGELTDEIQGLRIEEVDNPSIEAAPPVIYRSAVSHALQNSELLKIRQIGLTPALKLGREVWLRPSWNQILAGRLYGAVAQLGERLNGIQEVVGSKPTSSIGKSVGYILYSVAIFRYVPIAYLNFY